ncbi:MAG: hypothetical protein ACLQM8_08825 [Limisphaerales bacterium]
MRPRVCYASYLALAVLAAGCVVRTTPYGVVVHPAVEVGPLPPPSPPAVVPAPAYIPDSYVWDGYEYVGLCNGQYVCWSAGGWLPCDAVILGRFHGWERYHPGWRRGAFRYERGREPHR